MLGNGNLAATELHFKFKFKVVSKGFGKAFDGKLLLCTTIIDIFRATKEFQKNFARRYIQLVLGANCEQFRMC